MPNHTKKEKTMKCICHLIILVLCLFCNGCKTQSIDRASKNRLTQLLRAQGYSLYTPFRSDAMPGTIFVFTKNHEGWSTEFTLSPWETTFLAERGEIFNTNGAPVAIVQALSETNSLDGNLAVKLLQPVVDFSVAGRYAKNISVSFGADQKVFILPLERLGKLREKLADGVKGQLKFYQQHNQLRHCYIVAEALQVGSVDVSIELKKGLDAKFALDKIKEVVNVSASATNQTDKVVKISSTTPMLIGYKALTIDDTFLSDVTSKPPLIAKELSVDDIESIKK